LKKKNHDGVSLVIGGPRVDGKQEASSASFGSVLMWSLALGGAPGSGITLVSRKNVVT